MPRSQAENARNIAARQFSAIEHGLDDGSGFRGQLAETGFFFGPEQDAPAQMIRLHQPFHEFDLVEASLEKKACEGSQRFLAQIAPPVEIVAARKVARGEVRLVDLH